MSFIDPICLWSEILILSCLDFSHSWLSFCHFSTILSVYQHRSKDEHGFICITPTVLVRNRLSKCNICTARALERGLCGSEIQVFKLWPREDLNSTDTSEVASMCILKLLTELPVSLSQHAQDSELAAREDSCFNILVNSSEVTLTQ